MRELLESGARFSAVFCANDLSAMGALNAMLSSGRRVPLDLSLIGFDDVRLSPYTSPPLTTIHQPAAEIARHATELLLALIRGEQPGRMRTLFAP
jgi:LacI family transcriptional regulator